MWFCDGTQIQIVVLNPGNGLESKIFKGNHVLPEIKKKKRENRVLIISWVSDLIFESLGLPSCWFFFDVIYWPQMEAITYCVCYMAFFQFYSVSKWGFLILLVLCVLPLPRCFLPCVMRITSFPWCPDLPAQGTWWPWNAWGQNSAQPLVTAGCAPLCGGVGSEL